MYKDTDLAWIAGFFDGEGTLNLSFRKHSNSWQVRVRITNTHEASILRVKEILAFGHICSRKEEPYRRAFIWAAEAKSAEVFLTAILPFLVTKHAQATLALEAGVIRRETPRIPKGRGNGRGRSKIAPETHERLFDISAQIKSYNKHVLLEGQVN